MQSTEIIDRTVAFVKEELADAEGGHDWWHIYRVWSTAKTIARHETGADLLIVELGALLHDIADSKFHDGDDAVGPAKAQAFLQNLGTDQSVIDQVIHIIQFISFKGGHNEGKVIPSAALQIVQDADRLDAIGAIGIARAFNYGGFKSRPLYNPEQPPNLSKSEEQYKFNNDPTINHFYEKLFLLKDRMHTATGRRLAEERHNFMVEYVNRFYAEWEGTQ